MGKRQLHIWLTLGLVLYAVGTVLGQRAMIYPGEVVRLCGLALMLVYALRRRTLTIWIFFSMFAGVELGLDAPRIAVSIRVFSDIFLRLIKVIVAPLIFGTLVTGICGHGEAKTVGRLGLKSLVYFEVLTTIALVIGLVAIDVSKAGVGLNQTANPAAAIAQQKAPADAGLAVQPEALNWQQFLLRIFPENIAKAVADNQILQVAVFAILFGLALGRLSEEKRAPMLHLAESLTETMFAFTNLVMYFAPIGVGAALAYTIAYSGLGVMLNLGRLLLTLYAALIAFALLGMLPAALLARIPVRRFLEFVAEPATIAFATSTSEAALPRAMESMEAFGVPQNCGVRHSHGIQLQLGGIGTVPGAGVDLRGAGSGNSSHVVAAGGDAGHADADKQGRCGRAARGVGGAAGDLVYFRIARGADLRAAGHRCADGYGPDRSQCGGELPCLGRGRAVGG